MARRIQVLLVDPEEGTRRLLSEALAAEGYAVHAVKTADEALARMGAERCDLLISEVFLPGLSGIELLKRARENAPDLPAILIARDAPVRTVVAGMRAGALDCLERPIDLERFRLAAALALKSARLERENAALRRQTEETLGHADMVAGSDATREVQRLCDVVAPTDLTVLIQGESGVGKELVAQRIHRRSPRAAMPFIALNCGAIQPALLESELFGHEKGAFTGALQEREGLFELADRGTLFLDEIGEMSLDLQVKLLRVLESSEFRRVGGQRLLKVDARILAATNKRLAEEVAKGAFREDLFYRLNVIAIEVPPLRKRADEIPALVAAFVERARRRGMRRKVFLPDAIAALQGYAWPGNVRELENIVERTLILARGDEIGAADLPDLVRSADAGVLAGREAPAAVAGPRGEGGAGVDENTEYTLAELERRHIIRVLKRNKGNKVRSARKLGINVKTLYNKIKAYQIDEAALLEKRL
jgi:DNA-binding NtrC family response regulator